MASGKGESTNLLKKFFLNGYRKVEVLPNKETVQQTKEKRKKGE